MASSAASERGKACGMARPSPVRVSVVTWSVCRRSLIGSGTFRTPLLFTGLKRFRADLMYVMTGIILLCRSTEHQQVAYNLRYKNPWHKCCIFERGTSVYVTLLLNCYYRLQCRHPSSSGIRIVLLGIKGGVQNVTRSAGQRQFLPRDAKHPRY